jgi:protein NrfD
MNAPVSQATGADDRGPTYYGRASIKPAPWDPLVPIYVFLAGTAGGAAVVGAAARAGLGRDGTAIARNAHFLGLAGSLLGAPLLVADLKTPRRWYNMLRIFRPTSPMSIGSFVLTGFGGITALGSLAALASRRQGGGLAADLMLAPAAVTGTLMATYTASLLSATSVPLWASEPELLAMRYGTSAVASGAAVLSLAAHAQGRARDAASLDRIALVAAGAAFATTLVAERRHRERRLDGPYRGTVPGTLERAAVVLGALPLVLHGANLVRGRRSPVLSVAGSLAMLASSLLGRIAVMEAGPHSTSRPRDYLGFTQPHNLPPGERHPPLPRPLRDRPVRRR